VEYTRNYIEQAAALAEAMALPEGSLAIPDEPAAPRGDWMIPLPQTIDMARRQREEIMASLSAAESARWSGVAALRSYLPVFQLVATGNLIVNRGTQTFAEADSTTNTPTTIRNGTGAIGLGFTWSLFDGGIQAANAEAARAQARVQGAEAASTQLQVMRQVRSSYAQLVTARVALSSARQAYQAAELAKQVSWIRYTAGVGDITSVVQTIEQLSTAAQQVSTSTLSYNTALAQLYRYSAIWPPQTQDEVQQQLQRLRRNPTEPSAMAPP
jgi:outer membrane protein TolC